MNRLSLPTTAFVLTAAAALIALPGARLQAQESPLLWGGYLSTDMRLDLGEDFSFIDSTISRKELRLDLHMEANPGDRVRIYAEGWLRAWGFPEQIDELSQLASTETLVPLGFELREAYADIYAFPCGPFDLRVGRQRIAWGRADEISIVDNLDPDDLEDPWDFGRHLASDALKLTFYRDMLTVQGVYVPIFRPARIAEGSPLLGDYPAGLEPGYSFALPGADPVKNATLGLRASVFLLGWDVAASYIYGRDDLPTATGVVASAGLPPTLDVELGYLRQHVVSLDAIGELFGMGVWVEAAVFIPEEKTLVTDLSAIPGYGRTEEKTEPYVKALAGLDYTFPNGIYVNVQYAHGFPYENSRDALSHYLVLGLEWKLLRDRLTLGPLGFALEVDDFGEPADSWAFVLNPELSCDPVDNVTLTLGARWIRGEEDTLFGRWKDHNELYVQGRFDY